MPMRVRAPVTEETTLLGHKFILDFWIFGFLEGFYDKNGKAQSDGVVH